MSLLRLTRGRFILCLSLLICLIAGCSGVPKGGGSVAVIRVKSRSHKGAQWWIWLKNSYLYPGRDLLNPLRLPVTLGWPAADANDVDKNDEPLAGSFCTGVKVERLSLEQLSRGQPVPGAPVGKLTVTRAKTGGVSAGFYGADERGVSYLVKFDHPDFAELGTSAELIGGRVMWLLGYHVPPRYIITARVPGHPEYDGKRAVAIAFIKGKILGQFSFDWFRGRRIFRGLKLASAWLDNTDMRDHNTLQVWRDGRMLYYVLDLNDSLGSCSSVPKEPWRGWRYRWEIFGSLADILTLGFWPRPYRKGEPVFSTAVGRFRKKFDPRRWKTSYPNMAFNDMTEEDGRWMAAQLCKFTAPRIRAIVKGARLSRPGDEQYIIEVLEARRDRIIKEYLGGCENGMCVIRR